MSIETYGEKRLEFLGNIRKLQTPGFLKLSAGNVSYRVDKDYVLMTPSGVFYDDYNVDHFMLVDLRVPFKQNVVKFEPNGDFKPTIKALIHLALMQEFEWVNWIIHTHTPKAEELSILEMGIPPDMHYMTHAAGKCIIPCTASLTPGSIELAEAVLEMAKLHMRAILMGKHGQIVMAGSFKEAIMLVDMVETQSAHFITMLTLKLLGLSYPPMTAKVRTEVDDLFESSYTK